MTKKKEFSSIEMQVIRSIERSIVNDEKKIERLKEKAEKRKKGLEKQLQDINGILSADLELAQRDIEKALDALKMYTGESIWKIGEKTYKLADPEEEKKPETRLFQKEEEAEEQKKRDKEVSELPWDTSEETPFKNIF